MKEKKTKASAPKKSYFEEYVSLERFVSYFYQIDAIIKTKPKTVLEIGVGNKLVCNYLKQCGIRVTTCDLDRSLKPDKAGDIRKLPFKSSKFDTVVAFEVLEHIPFRDVPKALSELKRVSKENVIISIPYSFASIKNSFRVDVPFIHKQLSLAVKVPYFSLKTTPGGEHQWEMGRKYYPRKRIREAIRKHFRIVRELQPSEHPYHYFFILKKKARQNGR